MKGLIAMSDNDKDNNWLRYSAIIGFTALAVYCSGMLTGDSASSSRLARRRGNVLPRKNPLALKNDALGRVRIKFPDRIPSKMLDDANKETFLVGKVQARRVSLRRCGIYYISPGLGETLVGFIMPREAEPNKWTIDAIYIDPSFRDRDIAAQALILFFASRAAAEISIDVNDIVTHQIFGKAGFVHHPKVYIDERTSQMYNRWTRNPHLAVIIKDAPSIVEGELKAQADAFYNQLIEVLDTRGYSILFDRGELGTPLPKATVWIAHGNGEQKLHEAIRAGGGSVEPDVIFISEFSDASEQYQKRLESTAKSLGLKDITKLEGFQRPIPSKSHFELSGDLKGTLRTL
jgi:hypothetical protein